VEDTTVTPETIQRVRKALNEDTVTFGERFGRSGRTVEAWEQGIRNPDPLVLKELQRIVKTQKIAIETER
jgi:DNA-binding transcriptional regulator YiaG